MLKPRQLASLTLGAVLYVSHVADAATVTKVSGAVLVSKGDGFAPITNATEIAAGSRLLVQSGGLAVITYPSGCVVRVGPGMWQVQPVAPCANGAQLDFTGRMNDGAVIPGGRALPPGGYAAGFDPGMAVVGGGIIAFGLGIFCATDWCVSKRNSASP